MKKKNIVCLIISALFMIFLPFTGVFLSYKKSLYKRVNKFYKNCPQENCILNISDIFTFDWDTLFVFPPLTHYRDEYQELQDIARRIVFVKDGQIVYQEDELAVDRPYKVNFRPKVLFYTPEDAVFIVTQKESYKIGKFYSLYPIKK